MPLKLSNTGAGSVLTRSKSSLPTLVSGVLSPTRTSMAAGWTMNETLVSPPRDGLFFDIALTINFPGRGLFSVTQAIPPTSVLTTLVVMVEKCEIVAEFGVICEKLGTSGATVNGIGLPNLIDEV